MKFCKECSSELEPTWLFCKSCGTEIVKSEVSKTLSSYNSDSGDTPSGQPRSNVKMFGFAFLLIVTIGLFSYEFIGRTNGITQYSTFEQLQKELVNKNICKAIKPETKTPGKGFVAYCTTTKKFYDGSGYIEFFINFNPNIQIPVKGWKPISTFYNKIPQSGGSILIRPEVFPTIVGQNWLMYDPIGNNDFTIKDWESFAKSLGGVFLKVK